MPRFLRPYLRENQTLNEQAAMRNASLELIGFARDHRKAPTPAEATLWNALRNRQLDGLRFRRQHPVATFIFDFYCPALALVIELDGDYHKVASQQERDAERTAIQELKGYRVLRFRNEEVLTDLPVVLQTIREVATDLQSS
ncbi:MAG: endonuclease domain-containing protein [Armatimonas sp.]